ALRDDYTANALNQIVTRENNTVAVSGSASTAAAVMIKGRTAPAGRQGRYWGDEITVLNSAHPWRGTISIFAARQAPQSQGYQIYSENRTAEIAAALQNFTYDLDGNITSDGIWDYTWDAENRLILMETTADAQLYNFPHKLIEFRYDYLGRRVQKRVIDVGANQELSSRRYLYNGWDVIAEYLAPGGTSIWAIQRSYGWGLDIARTLSDAGGVGALLSVYDHPNGKGYFPTYDGNGNVVALVRSNDGLGTLAAAYEYGPFGETLRSQILDSTIADNPFRFSTKWTDNETGLVYYGRRYYDPRAGRFLGRDPKGEKGGLHLYGFCGNRAIDRYDVLGMVPTTVDEIVKLEPFEVKADRVQEPVFGNGDNWFYNPRTGDFGSYDPELGIFQDDYDLNLGSQFNEQEEKRKKCDELASKIANNERLLTALINRTGVSVLDDQNLRKFYDENIRPKGQRSGWASKGSQALYYLGKASLDAAGMQKYRKALTAIYKIATPEINLANGVGNTTDTINIMLDISDRNGGELIADVADTLLGVLNFAPGVNVAVLAGRITISVATNVWQDSVDEADRKSAERFEKATEENIRRGSDTLNNFKSQYGALGCP
ncbi:MAG: RHS repeat-associated core domain-containing protein, partial [Opitutaceae bacterium]